MSDKIQAQEDADGLALTKQLKEAEDQQRELEARGWVWRGDGELLSKVVDDVRRQAAIFVPSLKITPAITAGSNVLPLSFRQ